jgi:hypothetical protein
MFFQEEFCVKYISTVVTNSDIYFKRISHTLDELLCFLYKGEKQYFEVRKFTEKDQTGTAHYCF